MSRVHFIGPFAIAAALTFLFTLSAQVSLSQDQQDFSVQCESQHILFLYGDAVVVSVPKPQIAGALIVATQFKQNQPIVTTQSVSVWALKSNELQVHFTANPDATKFVVSASICGQLIPDVTENNLGVALAGAPTGQQAAAFVEVNPSGGVSVAARADSGGFAAVYAPSPGVGGPMAPDNCTYIVQPGDTLLSIAQRYNAIPDAILMVNGLSSPDTIIPGQQLVVPCLGAVPNKAVEQPCTATVYTVQKGDNLFRIALRYGTSVRMLAVANGINNPALIIVGQSIIIPCP